MKLRDFTDKDLGACTRLELFNALLNYADSAAAWRGYNTGKKKLSFFERLKNFLNSD